MKLVICCNHSWPHCGGSEKVTQQIAESLTSGYNYDVTILSRSIEHRTRNNGVLYDPCARDASDFIRQLKKISPNHTFVYSDYFNYWNDLLRHLDFIPGDKSIALVGMNKMLNRSGGLNGFISASDKFSIITHSDSYIDYTTCVNKGLSPIVIPNGVDLKEFDSVNVDFREKYNIETSKIILCVSNFFPGKGQEHLLKVLKSLRDKRDDFTAVFISTKVNFVYAQLLARNIETDLRKQKFASKFLTDIPRQDVVAAFKSANVFAFPSQKEVAPLVVLESMASGLPWVAMKVGHISTLAGGKTISSPGPNVRGFLIYDKHSYSDFVDYLDEILSSTDLQKEYGEAGRKMVEDQFDWSSIVEKYHKVFHRSSS